jgi:NarL family two-component system response regulator LiaR
MTIRVLIVDDHRIVRQGLRLLLEQEDGIEVVGECADGRGVLDAVRAYRPDVILLDLLMPDPDGVTVLRRLSASGHPEAQQAQVIALTSSQDDEQILAALRAGALSYLPKTADVGQVLQAVRAAAAGASSLDARTVTLLVQRLRQYAAPPGPLQALSPREREVLIELTRGRSNREIARALSIGEETVRSHVSAILAKLGLADRTQAAIFALRQRLIPLDE